MRDLKTFQEKIEAYRKNAPTSHTQKELAGDIPLDKDELSKRLNAYKHPNKNISPLSCAQVQAIVRLLARWGAIGTQEQAKELLDLMECPHFSDSDWKVHPLDLLRSAPPSPLLIQSISGSTVTQWKVERLARLRAMQADHRSFLHNRLESFVGRQAELEEIRRHISKLLLTGGYITIIGQAGQGKSSIIAKLVEEYGPEKAVYHFIPFNPGPDHQVSLLRDLMGRLIMKHDLSDLYILSENRSVLRDYFHRVLTEVTAKGRQEVIFIDGIDQLKEDADGERDLSFLPNNPPEGMVFVLGTRPNDVLRPLELRKPYQKYDLPNLSRQDFDLILDHREVRLNRLLVDQFYQAMQENALYLDLLAKELAQKSGSSHEEIIKRVTDNPENIFSLSIARLKRHRGEWREVIKPLLGVLLVAQEPLAVRHLREILEIDDERLKEGMARLGGLMVDVGRQNYSLFHLKLYDYLRQDESSPHKEYVFATDEEQGWHKRLSDWCKQDNLLSIWEDIKHNSTEQGRREYARKHTLTHLYHAWDWRQLFNTLDAGAYGRAKIQYDPSSRTYAHDLDLGRQAAGWLGWTQDEGLMYLPNLWRYTLLRCSLNSRADHYPLSAFDLLLLLRRDQEVLSLIELLTDPSYKSEVLLHVSKQIREQLSWQQELLSVLMKVGEMALKVENILQRAEILAELAKALVQVQQTELACGMIRAIGDDWLIANELSNLGLALAKAQQKEQAVVIWHEAEEAAYKIEDSYSRAEALSTVGTALIDSQEWDYAITIWREIEAMTRTIENIDNRAKILCKLGLASTQMKQRSRTEAIWSDAEEAARMIEENGQRAETLRDLGVALVQVRQWEHANAVWDEVEILIHTVEKPIERTEMLREFAVKLTQEQQLERAENIWNEAEKVASIINNDYWRDLELADLSEALAQAQRWEQAEAVIQKIDDDWRKALAMSTLGVALARVQQWQRAEKTWAVAKAIPRSRMKTNPLDPALAEMGEVFAQIHNWEQAEIVINTIEDSNQRAEAMSRLGIAFIKAGRWTQAEALWHKIKAVVYGIESNVLWVKTLSRLGEVLAQAKEWERAQRVWTEAKSVADTIQNINHRGGALQELVRVLARMQRWEQAEAVIHAIEESWMKDMELRLLGMDLAKIQQWEWAERLVNMIGESAKKISALAEIGVVLAHAQQWEQAKAKLDQAEITARSIEEGEERVEALAGLHTALIQVQQWKWAEAVREEIETLIPTIEDSDERAWALFNLGAVLAESHNFERAEEVIYTIEQVYPRNEALKALGVALAQMEQWDQAEKAIRAVECLSEMEDDDEREWALCEHVKVLAQALQWKRAETLIHSIEKDYPQVVALCELGEALARAQEWARAETTWSEAKQLACGIEDVHEKPMALGVLGETLARFQRWEQAEELAPIIEDNYSRAGVLCGVATFLEATGEHEKLLHLVQRCWFQADTREYAIQLFPMALGFIPIKPEIGTTFGEAFTWVDTFLKE